MATDQITIQLRTMHVVIIGNGISGITAARHIRKKTDYPITVISAESDYFFSRTALMYIYMGHMTFEGAARCRMAQPASRVRRSASLPP